MKIKEVWPLGCGIFCTFLALLDVLVHELFTAGVCLVLAVICFLLAAL